MRSISILDCTLRDGGYINSWKFGKNNIEDIIKHLEKSGIEIIECGFIEDKLYDRDSSVYDNADRIKSFIKKNNTMYVGMIALGDIDPEKVTPRTLEGIDGIRLTFHKSEIEEEFRQAQLLIKKGYEIFIQPVGTSTYSDKELIDLIERVNKLHPFAFYIVDTLGTMYPNDIQRIFSIIDNNLDDGIRIGFHSHNNLQLSFSNAQTFMSISQKRDIIIDSSVFGMGRGAGNLTTELITQYINNVYGQRYNISPLLTIMERYLNKIYVKTPWGYSSPYYLSAINNCHPNYANYLMMKKTLSIESISKILNLIPSNSRSIYDKGLIENLYCEFQSSKIDDFDAISEISQHLRGKKILILASGDSIVTKSKEIKKWIDENNDTFIIHINELKKGLPADALFISNALKAESTFQQDLTDIMIIATSNVKLNETLDVKNIDYSSLLSDMPESDNAGVMILSLLEKIGIKKVFLAGFDGYHYNSEDYVDYVSKSYLQKDTDDHNKQISYKLQQISQSMQLEFLTPTIYQISM